MSAKSYVDDRCWSLWLRQVFTHEQAGEILSEHLICCQSQRGHAEEHQSSTVIGEISWDNYDTELCAEVPG